MSTNNSATGRTYNLRQRKKVQDAQKTKNSSKIPVPKKAGQTKKTDTGSTKPKQRKARAVPDFKKLHQDWNNKFNKGKAINKKTCTEIQAFHLTRPVTRSQGRSDKEDTESDEQEEYLDDDALQSIIDGAGIDKPEALSGDESVAKTSFKASTGISPSHHHRQQHAPEAKANILSEPKPTTIKGMKIGKENEQVHKGVGFVDRKPEGSSPSNNVLQPRQHQEVKTKVLTDHKRGAVKGIKIDKENQHVAEMQKLSMKDLQKEFDIEFETDVSALNSILNNTGVSHARHNVIGRQTTAGILSTKYSANRQNKARLRTSIYDQPMRMSIYDRRWTKANLRSQLPSVPDHKTPSPVKPILATPARVLLQRNQILPKTPTTASRVTNPKFSAVMKTVVSSCNSPAIRKIVERPTPQRVTRPCSSKKVRWAEVLKSPENENSVTDGNGLDNVVTTLKFTDVDDEQTAATEVTPKQDTMTETYLQKVIELEEQLLQEIQKLQEENKPAQSNSCNSSTQLTFQKTTLKTMPVENSVIDLTRKDNTDDDSVNGSRPVDLTVRTSSRLGNDSLKVFKSPFPRDGPHPVISQDSTTSLSSARMLPDHDGTGAVSSRLCSGHPGSEVQGASPVVLTGSLNLTSSCMSNTPGSVRRAMNWESRTPRTGLSDCLTSALHSGTDIKHERDRIRDFSSSEGMMPHQNILGERMPHQKTLGGMTPSQRTLEGRASCQMTLEERRACLKSLGERMPSQRTLEGRASCQMKQFPAYFNTPGFQRMLPTSSFQPQAFHRHSEQSVTDYDIHRTLQFASPHTLSKHHDETLDLQDQAEDLTCRGISVPLKSIEGSVQYQSLRSTSVTDGRLPGFDTPRPVSSDYTLRSMSITDGRLPGPGFDTPRPVSSDYTLRSTSVTDGRLPGFDTPRPVSSDYTLRSTSVTDGKLPVPEVNTPRPVSSHCHEVTSSTLPISYAGSSHIISSTPQVTDTSSLTQPLSAWGVFTPHVQTSLTQPLSACETPGQLLPDDQYYKNNSSQPSETSLLNVIKPLAMNRGRLIGQSSVIISPVPRYIHRSGFTGVNSGVPGLKCRVPGINSGVPGLSDGVQQSALDSSGKDVIETCKFSNNTSKALISLTHAQKLDHVMKMALDNGGKYREVVLNEEVALFACRLTSKFSPKAKVPHDYTNPVGSTLLHGDETHFIPINDETELKALPVPGSAFMAVKH